MKKISNRVKSMMIIGILFAGIFIAMAPQPSAKINETGIVNLASNVIIEWKSQQESELIEPRGKSVKLDINVQYYMSVGGGIGAQFGLGELAAALYRGNPITVHLRVEEDPDWAEVTLAYEDLQFTIQKEPQNRTVGLTVTADEDAPAFFPGKVKIKATVDKKTKILFPDLEGFEQTFNLEFKPNYQPLADAQPVDTNTKIVGPMDTVVFPIEVVNNGNERSTIFFEVRNIPSGWSAIIADSIDLDVGQKKTVYLSIQPPRGFGYHYDREDIKVYYHPARQINPDLTGTEKTVSFHVESQGFSFVGGEFIFGPIILIMVFLFLLYRYIIKPRRMN